MDIRYQQGIVVYSEENMNMMIGHIPVDLVKVNFSEKGEI